MFIRLVAAGFLVALVASAGSAADEMAEKVVGTWKAKGSDTIVEFTKDGELKIKDTIGGKTVDFLARYEVKDGKISSTLAFRGESNPKVDRFVFAIKKLTDKELVVEDLTNEDRKGKPQTYTRETK